MAEDIDDITPSERESLTRVQERITCFDNGHPVVYRAARAGIRLCACGYRQGLVPDITDGFTE